jgi:glycosyltransferase involved in cell wall biosynthesis
VAPDLSVFHVIGDLHRRSGGPSRAVVDLTDELAQQPGLSVTLLFQSRAGQDGLDSMTPVRRVDVSTQSRWVAASALPFRRELEHRIRLATPSLIHVHGLWLPFDHWAVAAARRRRIPLIVQPHGMLEPWALEHRAWKKRLAMLLYQRRDLDAASLLIASSPREQQTFRQLGLRCPIAVIPHGIRPVPAAERFVSSAAEGSQRLRKALFLSRLHPVKGLPILINAWARLRPRGWRLVIAGPDEGGHLREVQSRIQQLGLEDSVRYVGEVRDEVKSELYRSADLFVLPTHTENFGLVIAEALAHGLPVITTKGAPWQEIETYRCGWWIEIGEEPLTQALREAMDVSDETRREMGERGRELARRFEWADVAGQVSAAYRWALGWVPKPDFVRTD